MRRDELIRELE